jgi:hypothetical protein
LYNSKDAIGTLFFNETNRDVIIEMAERYNINPALLAGVIAAEMDFDHTPDDRFLDGLGRNFPLVGGLISDNVGGAPGIASVHMETLLHAIEYLSHNSLPGARHAQMYDLSISNRSSFNGSVEAAAIVLAMYAHVHHQMNLPEDMAVVWGAYRTGIQGFIPGDQGKGYTSVQAFQNNIAHGTGNLPTPLKMGKNAFMSLPYFEYFMEVMNEEMEIRAAEENYWKHGIMFEDHRQAEER